MGIWWRALCGTTILALAACSGSGGTPTATRAPTSGHETAIDGWPQAATPSWLPPAAPIPGAVKGGTVTVVSAQRPATLDPSRVTGAMASVESGLLVRSLTQYVFDRRTYRMVLIPDLATDLGRPYQDFKAWRFEIRTGATFDNGQPVTPQDVRAGIERALARAPFPGGRVTLSGRIVTIHSSAPVPDMSSWVASPAVSPVPQGRKDGQPHIEQPWATGPYRVKPGSYLPGKSFALVRNRHWDPNTDPGRHQYPTEFDFKFGVSESRIDAMLLADKGNAQSTITYDSALPGFVSRFRSSAAGRLITGPTGCTYALYPDNRKITDVAVRRALGWAYPYQAAWKTEGEIAGVTRAAGTNLLPPDVPGRVEFNPLPGHHPGSTDPARAKAILVRAHALGYPIRFAYPVDDPTAVAEKNLLVRAFDAAGFRAVPVPTTRRRYRADFLDNPRAPVNVRSAHLCDPRPSGYPILASELSRSFDVGKGPSADYAQVSSRDIDARIRAIRLLPDSRQPSAWDNLDKQVLSRSFPIVVTGYGGVSMMRGARIRSFYDDDVSGMPTWKDLWILPG